MGSTGSGSFSDYSRRKPTSSEEGNGGSSGVDNCGQALESQLEEMSRCFYFLTYNNLPPVGTNISIAFNGIRIVAETALGEEIGYLPTKFNYLRFCLSSGFNYTGVITFSSITPTPAVRVDVVPV